MLKTAGSFFLVCCAAWAASYSPIFIKNLHRKTHNYTIEETKKDSFNIYIHKVPTTIFIYDDENNRIEKIIINLREETDESINFI